MTINYLYLFGLIIIKKATAELPAWSDPRQNPCAEEPGGWELIFWPEDGKCYRLFRQGPCPTSMELVPGNGPGSRPQCRCPPGTAQSPRDALCHRLFEQGPCHENEYFAPVLRESKNGNADSSRWGACLKVEECGAGEAWWGRDERCYPVKTRGPCPQGLLLISHYGLGVCHCDNNTLNEYYSPETRTCHEHYTRGPCAKGQLFLPRVDGPICACTNELPNYNPLDGRCYPLGSTGPCMPGQKFVAKNKTGGGEEGTCVCREGYHLWEDGACYPPFTRGPCPPGSIFQLEYDQDKRKLECAPLPCPVGNLYFPGGKGCHKIGTKGPCPKGQYVVPSSEEPLSYLGQCACVSYSNDTRSVYKVARGVRPTEKGKCPESRQLDDNEDENNCQGRWTVQWENGTCYKLYTRGPCEPGQWIVPDRSRGRRKARGKWVSGKCEPRPAIALRTTTSSTISV
ncbi:hypothetical protein O3M35_002876 [Rhynocoris fuscipes]|uniref:DUF4789 domain-containing protein n=1 Tax=Rhynocoris fuscipes TaxID=488301 RepID=A0AAW1CNP4_9HEMI